MAFDLFLIAPGNVQAEVFAPRLRATLEAAPAAALLLAAGERSDEAYGAFVRAVLPVAQAASCAVILDNRPELVASLGADGVQISTGPKALREAIALLKPGYIVGAGDIGSRHDAMLRGELDVDYLMFGDRAESLDTAAEMAGWWSETFEVPSVYLAAGINDPAIGTMACEFIGLTGDIWDAPEALAALLGEHS